MSEFSSEPLAARMRPSTIGEVVGQRHILGEGKLLRRVIEADRLTNVIFYGPPGCGKTSLAEVIARTTKRNFVRLSGGFSPKGPLGSRLVCADCGGFFGAKTWHSSDPYKTVIWRCNDKYRPGIERKSGGEKCCTGHVTEEKVMAAFSNIVADLIARKPQVMEACEAILHELLDSSATDEKRKRLEQEGDAIAKEIEALECSPGRTEALRRSR